MDVPYKGYTILPSSERQPDGRWLPVAELEVSERGVVTSRPPLRATTRDTRATRADADVAAVKMAKAWIDAGERPGAVEPDAIAPPRASQKPRAPEARAGGAARVRPVDAKQIPPPSGKRDWAGLYRALGLGSDEQVDRLSRVLAVHFLLDRLVTLVVATKLAASRDGDAGDIEDTAGGIVSWPMADRVDLGSRLGVIAREVAESIVVVDRLRKSLVGSRPASGKPVWDVSDAALLASHEACDAGLRRGIEAVQKLMAALP
jgi:hypothetical protein